MPPLLQDWKLKVSSTRVHDGLLYNMCVFVHPMCCTESTCENSVVLAVIHIIRYLRFFFRPRDKTKN